jgi:hypothetical protein
MTVCFECGTGPTDDAPLTLVDDRPGGSYGGSSVYACGTHVTMYVGDLPGLLLLARVRSG